MIIGVTGKSGVGKSYFCQNILTNKQWISVDHISHMALKEPHIQKEIEKEFGVDISNTDRKVLGDIIFNNRHQKAKLTKIIYSKVAEGIDLLLNDAQNNEIDAVIDWILLPHSEYFDKCDIKILITADESERVNHVMKRDNITREYLMARDNNSIEYNLKDFDYIIKNTYHK